MLTLPLLVAALVIQQFLPVFDDWYGSRILLMQLVFLCCAVTVATPTMLLLALCGGLLWDAQCALGADPGNPEVYVQPVESLRFGYSILLFGAMGYLMQGLQPLFRRGKWHFSALLSGVAVCLYLVAEYLLINFIRGEFSFTRATFMRMLWTSVLTMMVSPLVFLLLFRIAAWCGHTVHPQQVKKRRGRWS